jgi:GNAT superfamily N-acetyltransferase
MVVVFDACRPVDGYEWPTSVEDLARSVAHFEHCDPGQDMIFADVNGEMIGYGRGSWYREPDGTVLHDLTGHVAPAWRRRGLGRAILRWTEGRQRQLAREGAEAGPHLFQISAQDTEQPAAARQGMAEMLLGEGYTVVRRWYRMPAAGVYSRAQPTWHQRAPGRLGSLAFLPRIRHGSAAPHPAPCPAVETRQWNDGRIHRLVRKRSACRAQLARQARDS